MEPKTQQAILQATSNVIALEPGKFYILVFNGEKQPPEEELQMFANILHSLGITALHVVLPKETTLQVIESSMTPQSED